MTNERLKAKTHKVVETYSQLSEPVDREQKPYLQIQNVTKTFDKFVALRDVYLDIYPGEFICLLGPSGCGKTTLLRIICGLEQQTTGQIIQAGKNVSRLPASKRDFGIVFQSYALFPNLNVAQNIAYGLDNAQKSKTEIKSRVQDLLALVGLDGMENKYPSQMSGGQQQRVALARALALSPSLLLLDEPLSALDAKVRVKLRSEITQLQKRLGITTVMVTHDQTEALAMADRIVVMDKGYIAQVGTANSIYQRPSTPFVANFIGLMNFLHGIAISSEQIRCGNLIFDVPNHQIGLNQKVLLAIRPEDIRILGDRNQESHLNNVLTADVEEFEFLGSVYHLTLSLQGDAKEPLITEVSAEQIRQWNLDFPETLTLHFPSKYIQIFAD